MTLFFNSKLGPQTESVSSSSSPKDSVPSSPQVPQITPFKYLNVALHLTRFCCVFQKRQPDFDFIDPLAPKKARISHLSNRVPVASSSASSFDRREEEGSPVSKRSSLPSSVTSGPPTHLPVSSHPPVPSHQQPTLASNSNSPSTPEGCGTQDLPVDQSSSCRDPSSSLFPPGGALPERYRQPASVPGPASSPSPPPCTSLTVTSTVISSPPLSSNKFKKKSKKHKEKDREKDKGKRAVRCSTSPPNAAEQPEEARTKKRRSAEEESRVIVNKSPHSDGGEFSLIQLLSHKLRKHDKSV